MRTLLFGSLIVSLLIDLCCGSAAVGKTTMKDLEGTWISEDSLRKLRETMSSHASQPYQIIFAREEDGKGFKLEWANFHEGSSYCVTALNPTDKADEYEMTFEPGERGPVGNELRS